MIDLSIIIVSHNTKDLLQKCLLSIKKHESKNISYEIILVDNGSTNGTVEEIENFKFKMQNDKVKFKIIQNEKNLGFAKANNQGIKEAGGEFILLLNSDTEVLEETLEKMVKFMRERQDVGVLGCKIMNPNGTPQSSTGKFLNLWSTFLWLLGGERLGFLKESPENTYETDWVSGACFMIRREILDKVGLFDEGFFMYLEEMEWCYRIKKAGFRIYFHPKAQILHKSLGSSNRGEAIVNIYKSLLYFYKKHKNYGQYVIVKLLLVTKACVAIAIGIFTRNNYLTSTYKKALALSL